MFGIVTHIQQERNLRERERTLCYHYFQEQGKHLMLDEIIQRQPIIFRNVFDIDLNENNNIIYMR